MAHGGNVPNLNRFPDYFRAYVWEDKHNLYGYQADSFPDFNWIESLERRYGWLRTNCSTKRTASIYLMQEMIQWGGSQNGILQKFEDGIGEVNLQLQVGETIRNLGTPSLAIESALKIPGMGLTYASKLLRFIEPNTYGALDSRVRKAINDRIPDVVPRIFDGNTNSMIKGYTAFVQYLASLKQQLEAEGINRPACKLPLDNASSTGWRSADIEMALFYWAASNEP